MTSNLRICLIGNSHVGMLKAASANQPVDLSVVAKPGLQREELEISGGLLTARHPDLVKFMKRSGLPKTVSINDFDVIVFVAMNASAFSAVRMLQAHNLCVTNDNVVKSERFKRRAYISSSAYQDALTEVNRLGLSWQIAQDIRQASNVPIIFVPQPQPSVSLIDDKTRFRGFHRMRELGLGETIFDFQNRSFTAAFSEFRNSRALTQPRWTLEDGFLTAVKFSRDATRLDGKSKQPEQDILHANALLGEVYWRRIFKLIN